MKDRKLVVDFFFSFARLDAALKNTIPFCKGSRGYQIAVADWKKFRQDSEVIASFQDPNAAVSAAVSYFKANPPKELCFIDNAIKPRKVKRNDVKDPSELNVIYLTVIRNNLFHGAKIPLTNRDIELLQHGLAILHHCLSIREDVKREYDALSFFSPS